MLLLGAVLLAIAGPQAATVLQPAEAIARADAARGRSVSGTFAMKVAVVGESAKGLYLNDTADLRSPTNVTFRLTPFAARKLKEKLGTALGRALIGRIVQVRGVLRPAPIVNTTNGTDRSDNRVQYEVVVDSLDNLTIW
jgi:hypothetical protein